jgi:hypothetical protein
MVEWTADFSSPGSISIDKSQFIIIDPDGNVIITGVTNGGGINDDITTIKYDKAGKQLWVAIYNGPGNYHDRPNGIAVDQFSNVYVTGGSTGDKGTATDFVTIKYNSGGIEQWASRFAAKSGTPDESRSIAVDQNGNVYVTGYGSHIVTNNSGQDWITIKYNTNGKQKWIATYDDGIVSDGATALTIDGIGNVYVTGQCRGPAYHIGTIKYDTSGKKQWIKKYNGAAISSDKPMDIKVDKLGFVYITGHSSEANKDYITIKYDNNGNEIWKNTFNGLANLADEAESMLVDDDGSVYVLGYSTLTKNKRNRGLLKYDSSGREVWKAISEEAASSNIEKLTMTFDKESNILVTGSGKIIGDKLPTNFMVDCYSKDGSLLWQTYFTRENTIPVASAMVMDDIGNIYVTGFIMGTKGFFDYCTVKFSR